jgi:hypothetical protein
LQKKKIVLDRFYFNLTFFFFIFGSTGV